MKNISKIVIVALMAMSLLAWASPSGALSGLARSGYKNQYKHLDRHHGIHRYHNYYPRSRYYRYGYNYKPHHFRHGRYSHLGLQHSSRATRIHIRFCF